MRRILLLILGCFLSGSVGAVETIAQAKMGKIVQQMSSGSVGEKGVIEPDYQGLVMMLISAVNHDRMRIIAPIKKFKSSVRRKKFEIN